MNSKYIRFLKLKIVERITLFFFVLLFFLVFNTTSARAAITLTAPTDGIVVPDPTPPNVTTITFTWDSADIPKIKGVRPL